MPIKDLEDDGENINHPDAPATIILPAQDILFTFRHETDYGVSIMDMKEILTQIFTLLVNQPIHAVEGIHGLPQVDRMTDQRFHTDEAFREKVRKATSNMGFALYRRLREYGAYYQGYFSYFFDGLVGWDLILTNLPY